MLTQDEAELYDRQIRLWGVNAQSRLRQSKVLMLGFNGVASEVAKILVLAGIDTLTIVDDQPLQADDLTSNLFCRTSKRDNRKENVDDYRTHQVKDKLRTLNPLVKVNIDNTSILSKKSDDLKSYDLVTLHSFLKIDEINRINQLCRDIGARFYLVLDYGFFGFMFNDLGSEFKFTYEEFDEVSDTQNHDNTAAPKQSGESKDPINFDNEEEDEDNESSDNDNRHDSNRPKKRRRHHSPERKDNIPIRDINEKKQKVDTISYVKFEDMISLHGAKFDKKSSPVLFISIAVLKFFSDFGRMPKAFVRDMNVDTDESKQDLSKLNETIASMKDSFNLNEGIFRKLDPEWSYNINGSLSPVCAIVGGVAGQDMIRSLSNKDIPICNTFSFDGIDMSGVIERVGLKSEKASSIAPIIRDFLEID